MNAPERIGFRFLVDKKHVCYEFQMDQLIEGFDKSINHAALISRDLVVSRHVHWVH